jgi:hypothetical protein
MGDSTFGLAALGFWLFVGAAVVSGVWEDIRKREAEHETLRRLVESGRPIDRATMDKLLGTGRQTDRELRVAALILRYISPGLLVMGIMLSFIAREALFPLLGAAAITGLLSIGLMTAANYVQREALLDQYRNEDEDGAGQPVRGVGNRDRGDSPSSDR